MNDWSIDVFLGKVYRAPGSSFGVGATLKPAMRTLALALGFYRELFPVPLLIQPGFCVWRQTRCHSTSRVLGAPNANSTRSPITPQGTIFTWQIGQVWTADSVIYNPFLRTLRRTISIPGKLFRENNPNSNQRRTFVQFRSQFMVEHPPFESTSLDNRFLTIEMQ